MFDNVNFMFGIISEISFPIIWLIKLIKVMAFKYRGLLLVIKEMIFWKLKKPFSFSGMSVQCTQECSTL
jgi:hypothetical protein